MLEWKSAWGTLTRARVRQDTRDSIIEFVRLWSKRAEILLKRFIAWLGVAASQFHDWGTHFGLANAQNALVPRVW